MSVAQSRWTPRNWLALISPERSLLQARSRLRLRAGSATCSNLSWPRPALLGVRISEAFAGGWASRRRGTSRRVGSTPRRTSEEHGVRRYGLTAALNRLSNHRVWCRAHRQDKNQEVGKLA